MPINDCKQCGMCCKALILSVSQIEAKRIVRAVEPFKKHKGKELYQWDYVFIAKVLIPITKEQAIELNPHLKQYDFYPDDYFYKCPYLTKDNKCQIQDQKTKGAMCDGFPYYKRMPDEHSEDKFWYNPECGYREALKK